MTFADRGPCPKKHRRRFHPRVYAEIIEAQNGICAGECGETLERHPKRIEFDHEIPLWSGGRDERDNLQAMCKACHKAKTRAEDAALAKTRRLERAERLGVKMNRHDRMLADLLREGLV